MAYTKVNYVVSVNTSSGSLNLRSTPSSNGKVVGSLGHGEKDLKVTKISGSWYYVDSKGAWASSTYLKITSKTGSTSEVSKAKANSATKTKTTVSKGEKANVGDYASTNSAIYKKLITKNLAGIHGIPFQFLPTVDARLSSGNDSFGMKYAERIISTMPLLLMTPGRPDFLPSYSKAQKKAVIGTLLSGSASSSALNSILNRPGRYYTFKFQYSQYYKFVNPLLQTCARLLNIHNKTVTIGSAKGKLKNFKWENATNSAFKQYISQKEFVAFYLDSENQISESFSTSTTQSQLGQTVNGFSDTAKEIQFLLGGVAGKKVASMDKSNYDNTLQKINDLASKFGSGSKMINSLGEAFSTVAAGGKLNFPEIWSDTEFTKTYNISMKLRTPDCDKLSWYLNICVPLIHLLCLAAPQQMGPNGYSSPFLVRAFYKGIFNCDMGIITAMDISKGKEGAWTIDGLPTEVDVTITLKDLYSALTISNSDDIGKFMNNTSLMDYLANTCGLNVNKPELTRTLEIYLMLKTNRIVNMPNTVFTNLTNELTNTVANLYKSFGGF